MVLTAYSDVDPIVAAINQGKVDQFILKPIPPRYGASSPKDWRCVSVARRCVLWSMRSADSMKITPRPSIN